MHVLELEYYSMPAGSELLFLTEKVLWLPPVSLSLQAAASARYFSPSLSNIRKHISHNHKHMDTTGKRRGSYDFIPVDGHIWREGGKKRELSSKSFSTVPNIRDACVVVQFFVRSCRKFAVSKD